MKDNRIRLQKHLAECGVASRRKAEELIENGKVKVNGHRSRQGGSTGFRKGVYNAAQAARICYHRKG